MLTSAFKSCVHSSSKRWILTIGEGSEASASKKLKRAQVKRIGSMDDMRSFLKFIRLFRQSRGVRGKFGHSSEKMRHRLVAMATSIREMWKLEIGAFSGPYAIHSSASQSTGSIVKCLAHVFSLFLGKCFAEGLTHDQYNGRVVTTRGVLLCAMHSPFPRSQDLGFGDHSACNQGLIKCAQGFGIRPIDLKGQNLHPRVRTCNERLQICIEGSKSVNVGMRICDVCFGLGDVGDTSS